MKKQPKTNGKHHRLLREDHVRLLRKLIFTQAPANLCVAPNKPLVIKRGTRAKVRHIDNAGWAYVNFYGIGTDNTFMVPAKDLSLPQTAR